MTPLLALMHDTGNSLKAIERHLFLLEKSDDQAYRKERANDIREAIKELKYSLDIYYLKEKK